jgi:hypothetical protein
MSPRNNLDNYLFNSRTNMTQTFPNSSWYLKRHHSESWGFIDNLFTTEECEKVKALAASLTVEKATVGSVIESGSQSLNLEIRKNTLSWLNSIMALCLGCQS